MKLANEEELNKANCYGIVGVPLKNSKGEVIGHVTAARIEDEGGRIIYEAQLTDQGMIEMQRDLGRRLQSMIARLPE
jgi:hypothetical protein